MLLTEDNIGSYQPYVINKDQSKISFYDLPFQPQPYNLDTFTVSLNSSQGGGETPKINNYYIHNVNSHRALQKVSDSVAKIEEVKDKRALLFSDSSWAGSGSKAVALVTDMQRTWTNLRGLIAQAMGLSLFGMSNTMVDGCGSLGKMDEELCARWM